MFHSPFTGEPLSARSTQALLEAVRGIAIQDDRLVRRQQGALLRALERSPRAAAGAVVTVAAAAAEQVLTDPEWDVAELLDDALESYADTSYCDDCYQAAEVVLHSVEHLLLGDELPILELVDRAVDPHCLLLVSGGLVGRFLAERTDWAGCTLLDSWRDLECALQQSKRAA